MEAADEEDRLVLRSALDRRSFDALGVGVVDMGMVEVR